MSDKNSWIDLGFEGEMRVIDVETTGLYPYATKRDPQDHNIISVAVMPITFERGRAAEIGAPREWIIDPGRPIPPEASRVNGIYDKDVRGRPKFSDVAQEIRDEIGSHPVVGHNVGFDKRFLMAEFKRAGITGINRNKRVCTMEAACRLLRVERRISLDTALNVFSSLTDARLARTKRTHSAGEDVTLTGSLASILYQVAHMNASEGRALARDLKGDLKELTAPRRQRSIYADERADTEEPAGCGVGAVGGVIFMAAFLYLLFQCS